MKIRELLTRLATLRPLFHSEADFQHALAWEIHAAYPTAKVRLEYRPAGFDGMYVDLWVVMPDGAVYAIELKYKTKSLAFELDGEKHDLLNQAAQDLGRYDFILDVFRLEAITQRIPGVRGLAILLTNDGTYWSASKSLTTVDAAFRIHEGRALAGKLSWGRAAAAGTIKAREKAIPLSGTYNVAWTDYSNLNTKKAGLFRYALLEIVGGKIEQAQPV